MLLRYAFYDGLLVYWFLCIFLFSIIVKDKSCRFLRVFSLRILFAVVALNVAAITLMRLSGSDWEGSALMMKGVGAICDIFATGFFVWYVIRGGAFVVATPFLLMRFRRDQIPAFILAALKKTKA